MTEITREDLGYLTQELSEIRRSLQDIAIAIAALGECKGTFSGQVTPSRFDGSYDIKLKKD